MPHRRHRVRIHVHNRYEKDQLNDSRRSCRRNCAANRNNGDSYDSWSPDDNIALSPRYNKNRPRKVDRYHSAEEVCRSCPPRTSRSCTRTSSAPYSNVYDTYTQSARGQRSNVYDTHTQSAPGQRSNVYDTYTQSARGQRSNMYDTYTQSAPGQRSNMYDTYTQSAPGQRSNMYDTYTQSAPGQRSNMYDTYTQSAPGQRSNMYDTYTQSAPGQRSNVYDTYTQSSPRQRYSPGQYQTSGPCERFRSAEETCGGCERRPSRLQPYLSMQDVPMDSRQYDRLGNRNFTVYTALVKQQDTAVTAREAVVSRRSRSLPPPAGSDHEPDYITEEVIHTREHRWHIPRLPPAAGRRRDGGLSRQRKKRGHACAYKWRLDEGNIGPGTPRPQELTSQHLQTASERGHHQNPCRAASAPNTNIAQLENSSDVRQLQQSAAGRTASELRMGRKLVEKIAQQVHLDDVPRAAVPLVYHVIPQYEIEEPTVTTSTADATEPTTVVRLELGGASSTDSESFTAEPHSATAVVAGTGEVVGEETWAVTTSRLPAPLPRRQTASDPMLPKPPQPTTRTTRSVESQQAAEATGRVKKLRTRGALTRLRQRSREHLDSIPQQLQQHQRQQQPQLSTPVATSVVVAGKPTDSKKALANKDQRLRAIRAERRNPMAVFPTMLPGTPGFSGDGEATAPMYDTISPYAEQQFKNDDPYQKGGQSPYLPADQVSYGMPPRGADPYNYAKDTSRQGTARSPYLATPPGGRHARFADEDDELGSALYEQRYQPRRDNSPYLTRPEPSPRGVRAQGMGTGLDRSAGLPRPGRRAMRGGFGQRISRTFGSLRQRGADLYRKLSGRGRGLVRQGGGGLRGLSGARGAGGTAQRGRGLGVNRQTGFSSGKHQPVRGNRKRGYGGRGSDCCCSDTCDSEDGAVNCSFMFYFNGDGGPSPFLSNVPNDARQLQSSAGRQRNKYCGMCETR